MQRMVDPRSRRRAGRMAVASAESRTRAGSLLDPGFHRLEVFFVLTSVTIWTYVFNEWWGGELSGLLLAIAVAIPVGVVFTIVPSILLGTLARLPFLNGAVLTWFFIVGGAALGVYGLVAFEGATLAMVALTGAETSAAGIGRVRRA
jgi:hypothetical protein